MNDADTATLVASSDVPHQYVIQGRTVTLPVVVRDAAVMSATFLLDAAAVRGFVPHPELHVPELFPGRAVGVISCIEYRDNDLGIYNEVSIAFFVKHGAPPAPLFGVLLGFARGGLGAYIHRLPVTTSFSRDAGRDIWGFPKTVDQIEFRDAGARRECTLAVEGTTVFTLSIPRGGRRQVREMPQDAFASRGGVLYRTPSVMGGDGVGIRLGGATLTLGGHPIADELRALGLPKRALMSTWMEHMRARFEGPEQVAVLPRA